MTKFFKIILFAIFGLIAKNGLAQDEPKTINDTRPFTGTFQFSNVEFFKSPVTGFAIVFVNKKDSSDNESIDISSFPCYASEAQQKQMGHYNGLCYVEANYLYFDGTNFIELKKTEIPEIKKKLEDIQKAGEPKKGWFKKKHYRKQIKSLEAELKELRQHVVLVISNWGDMIDANGRPIRSDYGKSGSNGKKNSSSTKTSTKKSSSTSDDQGEGDSKDQKKKKKEVKAVDPEDESGW